MPPCPLRPLRDALRRQHDPAVSDAELLDRYISRRDEQAFAAIVHRHGPMVLGVCRRVLGNAADADDAFQATFLVLVVKAASIRSRVLLGNWLYGVAYNTARKAEAMGRVRRAKERATAVPPTTPDPLLTWEAEAHVDAELTALPDKYRAVIVACDLEGRSIKAAAAHLGLPPGTVATRLRRGRALLAARLRAHDICLTTAAPPVVPAMLATSTVEAAARFAAGQPVAGPISTLVDGVLNAMSMTRLKSPLLAAVVLFLILGGSLLSQGTPPQPTPPAASKAEDNLLNTLLALDKHLWEALARGDWRERQKFLADDFVSVSPAGKGGKTDAAASDQRTRCKDWAVRDAAVARMSKDVAVLTYVYDCKLLDAAGKEVEARAGRRASCVWINRDGGWLLGYRHDEPGPKADPAPPGLVSRPASAFWLEWPLALPLGEWTVEFSTGVKQVTTFSKDGSVTSVEKARKSRGKAEFKGDVLVVRYDDDRVERWVRAGKRMVVEQWHPAKEYPAGRPLQGVADPTIKTVTTTLFHISTRDILHLTLLNPDGPILGIDGRTNTVTIKGTELQIERMLEKLREIDVPRGR